MLYEKTAVVQAILQNTVLPANKDRLTGVLSKTGFFPSEAVKEIIDGWAKDGRIKVEKSGDDEMISVASFPEKAGPGTVPSDEWIKGLSREAFFVLAAVCRDGGPVPAESISYYLKYMAGAAESGWFEHVLEACAGGLINIAYDCKKDELEVKSADSIADYKQAVEGRFIEDHKINRSFLLDDLYQRYKIEKGAKLFEALERIDRIHFLCENSQPLADVDRPLPISREIRTTTSAPHAVILTLQSVQPAEGEKVLICNVKGGFLAALAGYMAGKKGSVTALDSSMEIVKQASANLSRAGDKVQNVEILQQDDVTQGLEDSGPWNIIIMNGSIPKIPYKLIKQLDNDNGRILFFLRDPDEKAETCYVIRKNRDIVKQEELSQFRFTPIYGEYGWDSLASLQEQYNKARASQESDKINVRKIRERSPYPLAKIFMVAFNSSERSEKHRYVLKAYEVLIKYYAILVMNIYISYAGKNLDKRFVEEFSKLEKPALGHWLAILRDTLGLVKENDIGRILYDDLNAGKWKDEALLGAFQKISMAVGKKDAGRKNALDIYTFLEKVGQYRNAMPEGHGAYSLKKEEEERSKLLLDSLQVILLKSAVLQQMQLIYVDDAKLDPDSDNNYIVDVFMCMGCEFEKETWNITDRPKPKTVYLSSEKKLLLKLSPWFVKAEGEKGDGFFIYNEAGKFITYYDANSYPPKKEIEEINGIFSRYRVEIKTTMDHGKAMEFINLLMDEVAEDGVITKEEMERLIKNAVKFNLADNEKDALEFIRRLADDRYPGIHYEAD